MNKQLDQAVEELLDLVAKLIARRHLQIQQANLETGEKGGNAGDTKSNKTKSRKKDKNENQ